MPAATGSVIILKSHAHAMFLQYGNGTFERGWRARIFGFRTLVPLKCNH